MENSQHQKEMGGSRQSQPSEEAGVEQPQTVDDLRALVEELEWRREAVTTLEGTLELIRKIILSDEDDHTKIGMIRLLIVE